MWSSSERKIQNDQITFYYSDERKSYGQHSRLLSNGNRIPNSIALRDRQTSSNDRKKFVSATTRNDEQRNQLANNVTNIESKTILLHNSSNTTTNGWTSTRWRTRSNAKSIASWRTEIHTRCSNVKTLTKYKRRRRRICRSPKDKSVYIWLIMKRTSFLSGRRSISTLIGLLLYWSKLIFVFKRKTQRDKKKQRIYFWNPKKRKTTKFSISCFWSSRSFEDFCFVSMYKSLKNKC